MEKTIKYLMFIAFLCFLESCGAPSGNAPSTPVPTPSPSTTVYETFPKFGETKSTSLGWEVTADTSDSIETKTLANGWTIEVLHE